MSYFTATGTPTTRSQLSSQQIRDQWAALEAAFDLLPDPVSGGNKGFTGGRWELGTIQGASISGSTLGDESAPCTAGLSLLFHVPSSITSLGTGRRGWVRNASGDLRLIDAATALLVVDNSGNVIVGDGSNELATSATSKFFYLPTVNGTPTGAPTAYTGAVPMLYDRSANKIAVYNGGWKFSAALA